MLHVIWKIWRLEAAERVWWQSIIGPAAVTACYAERGQMQCVTIAADIAIVSARDRFRGALGRKWWREVLARPANDGKSGSQAS